jgi:hypothetical protein
LKVNKEKGKRKKEKEPTFPPVLSSLCTLCLCGPLR